MSATIPASTSKARAPHNPYGFGAGSTRRRRGVFGRLPKTTAIASEHPASRRMRHTSRVRSPKGSGAPTITHHAGRGVPVAESPGLAAAPGPPSPAITEPFVLSFAPSDGLRLRLAVQADLHGGEPINRDYDEPYFQANGQKLTDQRQMRQGLIRTVTDHLQELTTRYRNERILSFVGNGNLLANYGFVAWSNGRLFHLRQEPVFTKPYTAIVSRADGRLTVEDVYFGRENGGAIVLRAASPNGTPATYHGTIEDITAQIDFLTTGQPLVRGGRPVPLEQVAQLWYDTRHLVQPLTLRLPKTALFLPNAQLQ